MTLPIIAVAAFAATLLGGLFALHLRDRLHLILGFSAGAVIGVAFFDLLPESLEILSGTYDVAVGAALIGLGFATYLVLDRLIILHHHHDEHTGQCRTRGTWGASTLILHSFLDGAAVGLAFQVSVSTGLIVALAVLAHDFSDGINTVSMIVRHGGERARAFRYLLVDALAPVLGIIAASFIHIPDVHLGALLALFTGFFLYIGASELLPESHHAHPVRWTTIATLIGMICMYIIITIAE